MGIRQEREEDITRREFMKKVGRGATALGVASVLSSVPKRTSAAERDYILIGRPNPSTGPLAPFGEPCPWIDMKAMDAINKEGGIYVKEYGKKVPVKMKLVDTESNPTKAGEIAARLIQYDKVDMMLVLHTPDVVNPVSAMCERYKVPCLCLVAPFESWLAGGPYHWSFDVFWFFNTMVDLVIAMWDELADRTNRVVGGLWPNDDDGVSTATLFHDKLAPKGYKIIDPGRFPFGTQDWTSIISLFKKENVEILHGMLITPDWISCWRQMHQQGFVPKMATPDKSILFPAAVNALGGDLPEGLMTGIWWSPSHPFKSSLTGETARDLCGVWTKETGKQWTQPLGYNYAGFEIVADVLKRAQSVDKETIREAIAKTDMETIIGPVKFNEKNLSETPLVGGQWRKGKEWPWDLVITYNREHPEIPKTGATNFLLSR